MTGPDPSWDVARLLSEAEGRDRLSAAWVAPLAAVSVEALDPGQRVTYALVTDRLRAVVEAVALRALAAVPTQVCPRPAEVDGDGMRGCAGGSRCRHAWQLDEFAALTGQPGWLVSRRYGWALGLARQWTGLAEQLACGQTSLKHVAAFDRASQAYPLAVGQSALADVLADATRLPSTAFARCARRAVARHANPADVAARHRRDAREETDVRFGNGGEHGMSDLLVIAPVQVVEAIRAAIEAHPYLRSPDPRDTRLVGQRRADALLDLCLNGAGVADVTPGPGSVSTTTGDAVERPGAGALGAAASAGAGADERFSPRIPVGVIVTASVETLEGSSNEPGLVGDTITDAAVIRQLAADPHWARHAVLDTHGTVVAVGARIRQPNRATRRAARHRHPRCTFPGCPMPARRADLDHALAFSQGGGTTLVNLHPLCAHHHRLKHLPGVRLTLHPDGSATWVLPSGRQLFVPAHDYRTPPGPFDRDVVPDPMPDVADDPRAFDDWHARHDPEYSDHPAYRDAA